MFSCSCPRPWGLKTAKKINDEQKKASGSHFLGEGSIPGLREEGDVKTSRRMLAARILLGSWAFCGGPGLRWDLIAASPETVGSAGALIISATVWQPQLSVEFGRRCPVGCANGFYS